MNFSSEKETAIKALMLMGTLLTYIKPHESTRAIDKIKRNVRKGLNALYRYDEAMYDTLTKEADAVWEKAKRAANNKEYTVSLIAMLNALWATLDGNRYQTIWFTEKTYQKAIASMIGVSAREDDVQVESDSYFLTDIFAEGLGVKKDSAFGRIAAEAKARKALREKELAYTSVLS